MKSKATIKGQISFRLGLKHAGDPFSVSCLKAWLKKRHSEPLALVLLVNHEELQVPVRCSKVVAGNVG